VKVEAHDPEGGGRFAKSLSLAQRISQRAWHGEGAMQIPTPQHLALGAHQLCPKFLGEIAQAVPLFALHQEWKWCECRYVSNLWIPFTTFEDQLSTDARELVDMDRIATAQRVRARRFAWFHGNGRGDVHGWYFPAGAISGTPRYMM
jgi:hypothetical protein